MVIIINIRSSGDLVRASRTLNRIQTKLPVMNSKAMMRWGKTLEKDMKQSARDANIKSFTGTIYNKGIEYRQRPNGKVGRLFIRNNYVMLDSMKPHWVNLQTSRSRLLTWASKSRMFKEKARMIQSGEMKKYPIYVRPHPFIQMGWRRARPKLRPILKQEMRTMMVGIK